MMSRKLNTLTVEALRYKAGVAAESGDDTESDSAVEQQCVTVAEAGTVEALTSSKEAMEELENYLGGDIAAKETKAIVYDLCLAGWYEKLDPDAVSSRRIKTRVVEGVRYVTGF